MTIIDERSRMNQILLLLDRQENCRLLVDWLEMHYRVLFANSEEQLTQAFDLCILDGSTLNRLRQQVQARKATEQPVFLPFLLISSNPDLGMTTQDLGQSVDEILAMPIEKVELHSRVEALLRSRRLSMELFNAKQELLGKEKEFNEAKSQFLSMVSHELRNPLTAILMSADLLKHYSHVATEEKKSQYLTRIEGAAQQMTRLLDDLLLLSRAEAGKLEFNPELLDIEKFCYKLVADMKSGAGNQYAIAFSTQGSFRCVCMDQDLLQVILTNLLSNAIKYSPQGSTIKFDLIGQDSAAIFQIQDEGIGITPEDQQRLYTSFHRGRNVGKVPGSGLGLAIVKNAVDLHGGQITFKSQVGVGTTFRVQIPSL
ncbi:MAG TPA: HAMP domain-containing sensor histidine kinase [Coleofasciculaceae cyanobacterium]